MSEEKKETIEGVEYTFKKLPPREWARLRDRSKDRFGNLLEEKYMSEIFEHIVIDPKTNFENFEDFATAQEVVNAAARFCISRTTKE